MSKLVSPENLASVCADHMAYELCDPSLLNFALHVQSTFDGQLKRFDCANCYGFISCEKHSFQH